MCLASLGFQDEEKSSRDGRKRGCVKASRLHTKQHNVCHTIRTYLAREAGAYAQKPQTKIPNQKACIGQRH